MVVMARKEAPGPDTKKFKFQTSQEQNVIGQTSVSII